MASRITTMRRRGSPSGRLRTESTVGGNSPQRRYRNAQAAGGLYRTAVSAAGPGMWQLSSYHVRTSRELAALPFRPSPVFAETVRPAAP